MQYLGNIKWLRQEKDCIGPNPAAMGTGQVRQSVVHGFMYAIINAVKMGKKGPNST